MQVYTVFEAMYTTSSLLTCGPSYVFCYVFRFAVIDLSAGPCTYGKIETEEGSVSSKTLPRLRHVMFTRGSAVPADHSAHNIFIGQVAALVATAIEHIIAPDVRYSYSTLLASG